MERDRIQCRYGAWDQLVPVPTVDEVGIAHGASAPTTPLRTRSLQQYGEHRLWAGQIPHPYGVRNDTRKVESTRSRNRNVLDLHIRGRDRDRAIERSPAFEFLDQQLCVRVVHSLQLELKADGIE